MKEIKELLKTIATLRDPEGGCPWDKEQTHLSLRPYVIEEAYEVVAAIESEKPPTLKDELGDLLLQVLLHAQIASEKDDFSFSSICENLNDKLIRRHPHVFGEEKASNPSEVVKHWDNAKAKEKLGEEKTKENKKPEGRLGNIPQQFPALYESYKIGKLVAKDNFDWGELKPIREKIAEELSELDEAVSDQKQSHIEEEMGDLLFTIAQYARKMNLEPEAILKQANRKFKMRYNEMESSSPKALSTLSKEQLENLWNSAKEKLQTE